MVAGEEGTRTLEYVARLPVPNKWTVIWKCSPKADGRVPPGSVVSTTFIYTYSATLHSNVSLSSSSAISHGRPEPRHELLSFLISLAVLRLPASLSVLVRSSSQTEGVNLVHSLCQVYQRHWLSHMCRII
jgi:hypothetical protein